jgi:hypothetical protein
MLIKTFFFLFAFMWLGTNSIQIKPTRNLFNSPSILTNGFYYEVKGGFYLDGREFDHAPHISYLFFYEDHSVLVYSYFLPRDSSDRNVTDSDAIEYLTKYSIFTKHSRTGVWGTYYVLNDTIKAKIYSEDPTVIPKRVPEYWTMKLLDGKLQLFERTCIRCIENPGKKKNFYTIKYNPAEEYKFISNSFRPDSSLAWFKKKKAN